MAITKNPKKTTMLDAEKASKAFIDEAGKVPTSDVGKTPVLFRFKNDFLERIDAAAKKRKLPCKAWVRTVIAEALAKGL